jgi:hypothetical protein
MVACDVRCVFFFLHGARADSTTSELGTNTMRPMVGMTPRQVADAFETN